MSDLLDKDGKVIQVLQKRIEFVVTLGIDDFGEQSEERKLNLPLEICRSFNKMAEGVPLEGKQWRGNVFKVTVPARGSMNPGSDSDILQELADLNLENQTIRNALASIARVLKGVVPSQGLR